MRFTKWASRPTAITTNINSRKKEMVSDVMPDIVDYRWLWGVVTRPWLTSEPIFLFMRILIVVIRFLGLPQKAWGGSGRHDAKLLGEPIEYF